MPESRAFVDSVDGRSPPGAQSLTGSAGDNRLIGDAGDTLAGQAGDDWYEPLGYNTRVVEAAGAGIDTVTAVRPYVLPDHVENLIVDGDQHYGLGNALANIIEGRRGRNSLSGGAGDDVLIGGAEGDYFIVVRGQGNDVIQDFKPGAAADGDFVRLVGSSFGSFAQIKAAMTQQGADTVLQNGPEVVVFRNVRIEQFTADDFQLPFNPGQLGELAFADEFDSLNLYAPGSLTGLWKTNYGFGGVDSVHSYTLPNNGELQIYTAPGFRGTSGGDLGLNPFRVAGGQMTIRADRAPAQAQPSMWDHDYTSGMLSTKGVYAQTYGYFEIRADIPTQKGLWPAFWLSTADGRSAELDILEALGHQPNGPYAFYHDRTLPTRTVGGMQNFLADPEGFHTYGLLWRPDTLTFYLDGVEVYRAPTTGGMHQPMHLIVNLAVGGAWGGPPDAQTVFPADYKIDYVRAWTLAGITPPAPGAGDPPRHLVGTAANDVLLGAGGADTLEAGAGNDYLKGADGADRLVGGAGDDRYVVHQSGDVVVELAGQGWDTVEAWADVALTDNVEFVQQAGVENIDAVGNALANTLRGNAGGNDLDGGAGADRLEGWGGRDRLDGGTGNDTLNGGIGRDVFVARDGTGRDVVEDFADGQDVIEAPQFDAWRSITQQGADALVTFSDTAALLLRGVQAGALTRDDFVLKTAAPPPTAPPPTGTIVGTEAGDSLRGTAGADRIEGRGGNDYIDGLGGADTLVGGAGNDSYLVDNAGDRVSEAGNEGQDSVGASVSFVLGDNVEVLTLKGAAVIDGTGNALNNRLTGNAAANRLDGAGGADWIDGGGGGDRLTGGAGSDVFQFARGSGRDVVVGFTPGGPDDRMVFVGFGSARPTVSQVGADTLIAFATGEQITLLNVNSSQLASQDWAWA